MNPLFYVLNKIDPRITADLYEQRRLITSGLICSALASILAGGLIFLVKHVVSAVQAKDSGKLVFLSLSVIALFVVKYWFTMGQSYLLSKAGQRLTASLRVRLFRKLQQLPISYFNEKRSGALQSVLTNDVNVYQSATTTLKDSIDGPLKIVIGSVTAAIIHPQLFVVSLAVLPLLSFVIQRNARKMRAAQAQVQTDLAILNAMTQDTLHGTRIVKAFGAEDRVTDRYTELVDFTFRSQMAAVRRIASLKPLVELIGAVGIALVVLVCAYLVKNDKLEVADLTAFLLALDTVNQGFRSWASMRQTISQVQAASKHICEEVLDVPDVLLDEPGSEIIEPFHGKIEFRDVKFTYPDGTEALKGVSFVLEPGQSLALVGPSGSGKSTLADLLLRYYEPTSGQILFDGKDVRTLQTSWLRSQIGVVPQQTFLFAGTIGENIRIGKPDATEDEIWEAIKAAHAEFVRTMPEQLGEVLGERGVRVSGGEAQRISIARAFIRKPHILLLDEATSNLDPLSEKAVQQALDELMVDRTTVTIAHRLSTAARANKVLVISHGEQVEYGTVDELLAQQGVFAGMYRAYREGLMQEPLE
ncbi:MAG: ABC transporter ATP-binding protein [Armatimonadetes bacterium]|nr:ABC transporter ATP-binding protein [Armatimonadota bacterium]